MIVEVLMWCLVASDEYERKHCALTALSRVRRDLYRARSRNPSACTDSVSLKRAILSVDREMDDLGSLHLMLSVTVESCFNCYLVYYP